MVVRDGEGTVRAFHNLCRHRGSRLCLAPHGELGHALQCPYHAWTYGLDGALRAAPNMAEVAGFDSRDHPLKPVALADWQGLLFLNLASGPGPLRRGPAGAPGQVRGLAAPRAAVGPPERLRRRGQLEAVLPQLQRVLSLPEGPSAPQQADALPQHRERPRRRAGPGRADVDEQPRGEHDDRRRALRRSPSPGSPPRSAGASTTTRSSRAPSCRSTPTTCWSTARSRSAIEPHPHRLRLVLPSGRDRRAGLRSPARHRLLGPDQPPGLGAVRQRLQGRLLERLGTGTLFGARKPARRLRPAVPAGPRAGRSGSRSPAGVKRPEPSLHLPPPSI